MLKYLLYAWLFVMGASLGIYGMPFLLEMFDDVPRILENVLIHALIGIVVIFLALAWTIPYAIRRIRMIEDTLIKSQVQDIAFATIGMIIGLLLAVLISFLIGMIDIPIINNVVPFFLAVVLGYLGFQLGHKKFNEAFNQLPFLSKVQKQVNTSPKKFLDTSAIIDGRIIDVVKIGFLEGEIVVPQFVLDELQLIADSTDSVKRDKGQRGLDLLSELRQTGDNVYIMDIEYDELDVDAQLIKLAKDKQGIVVTTDFNLNKVCKVQGIPVLNVNELSDAVRMMVSQGDILDIFVSRVGKEEGQGVGYLDDGTMVVVEEGKHLVNEQIRAEVKSVLQTNSGRIIFTRQVDDA